MEATAREYGWSAKQVELHGPVVVGPWVYQVTGGEPVECPGATSGLDAALSYSPRRHGELRTRRDTLVVWRRAVDAQGELVQVDLHTHTVAVEPQEPPCCAEGVQHDWVPPQELEIDPGASQAVQGLAAYCVRCGCAKCRTAEDGLPVTEYLPACCGGV
jgi:hypothetical protein